MTGAKPRIGILGITSGVVLMLIQRRRAPKFFQEPRLVYGDAIRTVTPESEFAPADSML